MKHCTRCGHVLGLGRFCTNCGAPVATRDPLSEEWRENTAERRPGPTTDGPVSASRAVVTDPTPPRVPPAAVEPPPPPRFPLFADEVPAAPVVTETPPPDPVLVPVADDDWDEDEWDEEWEGGRSRTFWVVLATAGLAVLVVAAWFLGQRVGGDDGDGDPGSQRSGGSAQGQSDVDIDHTAEASAQAPATAPPGEDVDGNATSYDASNMLDGVPATTWRAEGDLSGEKIVFTFPEKTRITEVGLINGYAKKAKDGGKVLDWYEGHRRIQTVLWIFADGRSVRQSLSDSREMQTIEVEPVEVTKVVLKIVATTEPGDGAARRDMTAISDVILAETS